MYVSRTLYSSVIYRRGIICLICLYLESEYFKVFNFPFCGDFFCFACREWVQESIRLFSLFII